jgi:eIF-2B alpha/beta/delta-like uncharacterized protein
MPCVIRMTPLSCRNTYNFPEVLISAQHRPYNQGARLTAYELVSERIPATLIVDSAAAALLATGRVDAVVVGADRVAANGDTANKIGTRMLAIAARAAGVPFFVAAPTTSIDLAIAQGGDIEIEERGWEEVTHAELGAGKRVAVEGIDIWNPAFDVADAADITGALCAFLHLASVITCTMHHYM